MKIAAIYVRINIIVDYEISTIGIEYNAQHIS